MKQEKHTYCRICEPNCGILATVVDGRIERIRGDAAHPYSRGYLCPRGRASLDVHRDPDRLRRPLARAGEGFREAGWEESIADVGQRLKKIRERHGKDSIGVYFGNPLAFDFSMGLYMPLVMRAMGTKNFFSAGSQDCNNKFAAARRVYGSPLFHPVPDVERIEFLIIIGSNPAVSQMSFLSLPRPVERLRGIVKRGGRVIIIDPRRTETARLLGEHIFIRPDTDVFLLLSMLQVIISEGLYDREAVQEHLSGVAGLEELCSEYPPARASEVTGIPAGTIEALARDFATAKNAGVHASLGINLGSFGTLCYWLVQCLNAVTGQLDRRGSMLFPETMMDFARLYSRRPGKSGLRTSRIGGYPLVMGTAPAGVMADEILTPGEGQVRALVVIAGNPMLTVPDQEKLGRALKSLELMVCLDFYLNETANMADYVLPCKDMYERWDFTLAGMAFNPFRHVNYAEVVVEPDGGQKDAFAVMHAILGAAGYAPIPGSRALSALAGVLDRAGAAMGTGEPWSFRPRLILKAMLALGGVSWRKLKNSPQGLSLGEHRTGRFFSHRILTPDRKANLAPPEFLAEAGSITGFFEEEMKYRGFKLVGQRQRRTHNSWFHNVPRFMGSRPGNHASINPADAARLGVGPGDMVVVESEWGRIEIPVLVTDDVMEGVVSIPHGWGHALESGLSVAMKHPGVNVNLLTASGVGNLEKFAGMARLTGVRVTVTRS